MTQIMLPIFIQCLHTHKTRFWLVDLIIHKEGIFAQRKIESSFFIMSFSFCVLFPPTDRGGNVAASRGWNKPMFFRGK